MKQINHNYSFIQLLHKFSPFIKTYHSSTSSTTLTLPTKPTSLTTPTLPTKLTSLTTPTLSTTRSFYELGLDFFILDQVYDPTPLFKLDPVTPSKFLNFTKSSYLTSLVKISAT